MEASFTATDPRRGAADTWAFCLIFGSSAKPVLRIAVENDEALVAAKQGLAALSAGLEPVACKVDLAPMHELRGSTLDQGLDIDA